MTNVPRLLHGARVLRFADVSALAPTGKTRHVVRGREVTHFARLAIAQYESNSGLYLFYCDDDWNVITDTYHDSLAAAIKQAEFEFGEVAFFEA